MAREQLRHELARPLGPLLTSTRVDPGGGILTYLMGGTADKLANHFFGPNGWRNEILPGIGLTHVVEVPQGLGGGVSYKVTVCVGV